MGKSSSPYWSQTPVHACSTSAEPFGKTIGKKGTTAAGMSYSSAQWLAGNSNHPSAPPETPASPTRAPNIAPPSDLSPTAHWLPQSKRGGGAEKKNQVFTAGSSVETAPASAHSRLSKTQLSSPDSTHGEPTQTHRNQCASIPKPGIHKLL